MDPLPDQKIESAWPAVIDYLHGEMPRGWFDSWVKPSFLVSFAEECFTVGCVSADQRDWLTDRLKSKVERFLIGFLNQPVKVLFQVVPNNAEESSGPHCPVFVVEDDPQIEIDVLYTSIRNNLIEPNRVVRLPVYWLRWLPYVGPQTIFLVMALWQEYYLSRGGKIAKGIPKVNVRAEHICQWAGISRAQFFRMTQPGSPMGWFAQKIETDYEIDRRTGHAKKSANKYTLFDLPFTPGDAIDLTRFLISHDFNSSPDAALRAALAIEPKQILKFPILKPPDDFYQAIPHRITVQETIRSLGGNHWNPEISDLADRLADRLTGQGEFILVTWYFLNYWLPLLGPNAAMMILILRNLCYFNDETGEIRDEIWIDEGYEGMAARLGIRNSHLVASWFPAVIQHKNGDKPLTKHTTDEYHRRMELQKNLSCFTKRIDHRKNASGYFSWKFKVERTDPLIPGHEALRKSAIDLITRCQAKGVIHELYAWIDQTANHCFETVNFSSTVDLRLSNLTKGCSETLVSLLNSCFETVGCCPNDCFETLLKILKSIKDSQMVDTSSTHDSADVPSSRIDRPVVVAATDPKGNWSLEKLLGRADSKNRQVILTQEDSPIPFVSWLIYGVSQPCIQNPLSLAIAKIRGNPRSGAGGACERLASLPPETLASLVVRALGWNAPTDPDWRMQFGSLNQDRTRLLADLLQIELKNQEG